MKRGSAQGPKPEIRGSENVSGSGFKILKYQPVLKRISGHARKASGFLPFLASLLLSLVIIATLVHLIDGHRCLRLGGRRGETTGHAIAPDRVRNRRV